MIELFPNYNSNSSINNLWIPGWLFKKPHKHFLKLLELNYKNSKNPKPLSHGISLFGLAEYYNINILLQDGKINPLIILAYIRNFYKCVTIHSLAHAFSVCTTRGVYIIWTGDENYYVGKVDSENRNFYKRWIEEHLEHLQKGIHHCKELQDSYDETKFFFPMILYASKDKIGVTKLEKQLINSTYNINYNIRKW